MKSALHSESFYSSEFSHNTNYMVAKNFSPRTIYKAPEESPANTKTKDGKFIKVRHQVFNIDLEPVKTETVKNSFQPTDKPRIEMVA